MDEMITLNSLVTGARRYLALAPRGGWTYSDRKADAYRFSGPTSAREIATAEQERLGRTVLIGVEPKA